MTGRGLNLCKCRHYGRLSKEAVAVVEETMSRALLSGAARILTSAAAPEFVGAEIGAAATEARRHVDEHGRSGWREDLRFNTSVLKQSSVSTSLTSTGGRRERDVPSGFSEWRWQGPKLDYIDSCILARQFGTVGRGASGTDARVMARFSMIGGLSTRSYSAEPSLQAPITAGPTVESKKVFARIFGTPKYMFKSDVLWILRDFNLGPDDVTFIYDSKYRLKFIQVKFPSMESVRLAQRSLSGIGRFGGRYLKLATDSDAMDEINENLAVFRGRSLLMINVHFNSAIDEIERLFSGYSLDSSTPIKLLRIPAPANYIPRALRTSAVRNVKNDTEIRAIVRFRTKMEALRALRERQGAFCRENAVELRLIE